MTILLDFSAWKSKPAHFRGFIHWWRSVLAENTEEDSRFKSSKKAHTKGSGLLLIANLGTFVCKEYSTITFIPARNKIIEIVLPANIPRRCLCQLLVTDSEKDLLKIPILYDSTICIHWFRIPYLWRAKNINLWGIDPYAFAISNQIDGAEDFLALASFNTDQSMDKCSQQPGTFSMQTFCTDKVMILLLWTRWLTNRLEISLRKSLPSTFKRGIG